MRALSLVLLLGLGCHREPETNAVTIPTASASSSATPVTPSAAASTSSSTPAAPTPVTEGAPSHFKSGGRGTIAGVTFTVRMLPKLMVSGPQPEIEQAQIDCERGAQHGTIQVDTRSKRAEWGGLEFELGYADVYHDDIELTVRKK